MNFKKILSKLMFVLFIVLMNSNLKGQKVEFETVEINYGDIAPSPNEFRIKNGKLQISKSITLEIKLLASFKNINDSDKISLKLVGTDYKGKNCAFRLDWIYSAGRKLGNVFKDKMKINVESDNPIFLNKVEVLVNTISGKEFNGSENFNSEENNNSFDLKLNGFSKPRNGGSCKYGQCWCFSSCTKSSGKFVNLGNIIVKQFLTIEKEKSTSTLEYKIYIKNYNSDEINLLKSILIWGEASISNTIVDEYKNEIKLNNLMPTYTDNAIDIPLFEGKIVLKKAEKNRIRELGFADVDVVRSNYKLNTMYYSGFTDITTNKQSWEEVWLIDQGINFCTALNEKEVYINQKETSSRNSIEIGFDKKNTSEQMEIEQLLSSRRLRALGLIQWIDDKGKIYEHRCNGTENASGKWFLTDTISVTDSNKAFSLHSIKIIFINVCKDSFLFEGTHKYTLKNNPKFNGKIAGIMGYVKGFIGNSKSAKINSLILNPNANISISGGNIQISEESKFSIVGSFVNINNGNINNFKGNNIILKGRWDGKYSEGKSPGEWSSSAQIFTYSVSVKASKDKPLTINEFTVEIITENKDTISYRGEDEIAYTLDGKNLLIVLEKLGKTKYYNPCATKYKLDEVVYSENLGNGIYTCKFWVKLTNKSDVPKTIAMIVEIKDCKGNENYIKIALQYDEKTNTYIGSEMLSADKNCNVELVYGEIAAYNSCKDRTVWSFDATKSKGNGSGTKAAATQNSTKPLLF